MVAPVESSDRSDGPNLIQRHSNVSQEDSHAEDDLNRSPSIDLPNLEQPDEQIKLPTGLQTLSIYSSLAVFSFLGCFGRIGLTYLATHAGQQVFPTAAAQAVGCAVMGLVVRNRRVLESIDAAIYLGLGTGFCGSMTTFSSWMIQTFEAFSNSANISQGGIKNVVGGLTQIYITFAVATAGLRFGIHTSTLLISFLLKMTSVPREISDEKKVLAPSQIVTYNAKLTLHGVMVALAILLWILVILLSVFKSDWRHITLALVFAPLGTWTRYFLATLLNSRNAAFPWGTFTANILGTALDALFTLLQRSSYRSFVVCSSLQGLIDGYCGCLTTVSTLATEIRGLRRYHAYRYAVCSVFVSQALIVLIYGTYWWSRGLEYPAGCRFYP